MGGILAAMNRLIVALCLSLVTLAGPSLAAPQPKVVSSAPCAAQTGTYEEYVARGRQRVEQILAEAEAELATASNKSTAALEDHRKGVAEFKAWQPMPKPAFDAAFKSNLTCERFVYLSGGLKIIGYAMRAIETKGRAPVLLFLRGGNRDFGRLDEGNLAKIFAPFARKGYVVIGTQYRGAEGGDGKDEFGGRDVDDVLALAELARARPDADPANVFLYGVSRGGMEAYLSLHRGLAVNAAVIHAGVADLEGALIARPMLEKNYEELIPDYKQTRATALRSRSAIFWADELRVPLLLVHGTADWRVPAAHVLQVAEKLQAANREYGLILYSGDNHGLTKNFADVINQTHAWFTAHRKP